MRKLFCMLLALMMVFSLVACGDNVNGGAGESKPTQGDVLKPDIGDKGNGDVGASVGTDTGASTEGSEDAGTPGSDDTDIEVDPEMGVTDSVAQMVVTKIAEANPETFAANMTLDAEMIGVYYEGLSDVAVIDMAVYMPMMSAVVCEIAIVEVADPADIDAVKEIFQNRIAYQVGDDENPGGAWYPESIEGWKNHSEVVVEGNYVMLIAWEGKDSAVEIFRETVGA